MAAILDAILNILISPMMPRHHSVSMYGHIGEHICAKTFCADYFWLHPKSSFGNRTSRFYGKITGNQLPVHFPFLRAPVSIFRNQAQYGSKKTCTAFGHIALKIKSGRACAPVPPIKKWLPKFRLTTLNQHRIKDDDVVHVVTLKKYLLNVDYTL